MRRFLDRLYIASGALGAAFIALICVLMITQSVLREFGVRTGAMNDVVLRRGRLLRHAPCLQAW